MHESKSSTIFALVTLGVVPTQAAMLAWGARYACEQALTAAEFVGLGLGVGGEKKHGQLLGGPL